MKDIREQIIEILKDRTYCINHVIQHLIADAILALDEQKERESAEENIIEYLRNKYYPVARSKKEAFDLIFNFLEEYAAQSLQPEISQKDICFAFIDWLWSAKYSKYWGSDEPNNGKWYKLYSHPDRRYYTLKELFELAMRDHPEQFKNKYGTKRH